MTSGTAQYELFYGPGLPGRGELVAMAALWPELPGLQSLRERVGARPRIQAYLASPRRLAFNENGIFRRYPELDLLPTWASKAGLG